MLYKKIVKAIVLLLILSIKSHAQNSYSASDFIPYKMIDPVDSLFTQLLDSLNEEALEGLTIDLLISFCEEDTIVYSLWLTFLPEIKTDSVYYLSYLARNTNHFYISNNKKYKIPIVFGRMGDIFIYDNKKYPLLTTDTPIQLFSIIYVRKFHEVEIIKCKAPFWALKSEYKEERIKKADSD